MGLTFWSRRPSRSRALVTLACAVVAAGALALVAARVTPRAIRSQLALEGGGLDEFYLTEMSEDPARVVVTSKRENSTWKRGTSDQAGDPYWIRRYSDPARPGLPDRILLTSRSRGAHLLIPLGALDLERALTEPATPPAQEEPAQAEPGVRSELAQIYLNRSFAGVYLHLRFPKRPPLGPDAAEDETLSYDLLVVRGNRLRTTDFLLQPNGQLYRSALADGLMASGPFRRNESAGNELVALVWDDPERASASLYLPVSLFDELGLCWGGELPTVIDDRWRVEALPAYALHPPSPETRAEAAWNGALHLASRFESLEERGALARALQRFGGS